jgi:CBS domain containing-hemolysin-like protein
MLIVIGLALILALTVATGYFVAQEFSYVAVDRNRLHGRADGAQLGITVTALLAGWVAQPYLGKGLEDLLGTAGLPAGVSLSVSVILALLLATIIQMVLGELAPKNLAIARAEAIALRLSRSTLIYLTVAGPLIRVFDTTSNRILRRVGIEPVEELPQGATAQDLDCIIITVHEDDPLTRVVELLDTGHSRFPVIGASVDEVIGVIAIGDVVEVEPADRSHVTCATLASPPVLVPFTLALPAVLQQLRTAHRQLAVVVDEFGGFDGVVSLEDIAEELVGEIHDEDDLPVTELVRNPDGSWALPARWRIDQVAEGTGIHLPEDDDYDTVSGLIMARLGRIPQVQDELIVELPPRFDHDGRPVPTQYARLQVLTVLRHVPGIVELEQLA